MRVNCISECEVDRELKTLFLSPPVNWCKLSEVGRQLWSAETDDIELIVLEDSMYLGVKKTPGGNRLE